MTNSDNTLPNSGSQDGSSASTGASSTPPPEPPAPHREAEISLLDLLVVLARNRRFIIGCVAVFTLLGLIYAVTATEQYTSRAQVVREVEGGAASVPGGLSALRGLGISLGGGSTGLTAEAYPRILTSREVRLAVVRDTFYFAEAEQNMRFVDYYANQERGLVSTIFRYTIGLPGQLLQDDTRQRPINVDGGDSPMYPTEAEEQAMKIVEEKVSSSVDVESGVMTISVTDQDPVRAAEITESFLTHLTDRVRTIRTQKARQTLSFVDERFEDAQAELEAAEQRLAAFNDRNRDIQSARLRTERDRLRRQVQFAADLYSEFQTQRTQAQIDLQRSEPVITMLEAPTPPMEPSAPQRTFLVVLSSILGAIVGVGGAFIQAFFADQNDAEEQEKMQEVKAALRNPLGTSA